mmetsp:Transcript_7624/g.15909  ORF Transcript_7624/g.15909 Transcript_7624/m.15909 type:complete len:222 (-) Transcript_7624:1016-1681(-)
MICWHAFPTGLRRRALRTLGHDEARPLQAPKGFEGPHWIWGCAGRPVLRLNSWCHQLGCCSLGLGFFVLGTRQRLHLHHPLPHGSVQLQLVLEVLRHDLRSCGTVSPSHARTSLHLDDTLPHGRVKRQLLLGFLRRSLQILVCAASHHASTLFHLDQTLSHRRSERVLVFEVLRCRCGSCQALGRASMPLHSAHPVPHRCVERHPLLLRSRAWRSGDNGRR